MKIRIEISSLASKNLSGVASYTKLLTESFDKKAYIIGSYFNFLGRQPQPRVNIKTIEENNLFPLRIYAKLQGHNIAPPFDFFKSKVDLTIFPNFATWPSVKTKLKATVIHDLTYIYYPELVEEKNLDHLRRVVPESIKKADFIVTISEAVKLEIIKEFSISPERVVVTPIPPDQSFYKKINREVHNRYSIPTRKYIYFIGNLEPRKNLPTLIAAYRKLPEKIKSEYSLVMAGGKGWKIEKSLAAIEDAQAAGENVIHVGYIDQADSPTLYQKASLTVMPSFYEGFGMPILESFACQTPVLASDIPVLRETGGNGALYASPNDPDDFANKMSRLLTEPQLVKKLQTNANKRLLKISWQDNAAKIIKQSNKLLNNS